MDRLRHYLRRHVGKSQRYSTGRQRQPARLAYETNVRIVNRDIDRLSIARGGCELRGLGRCDRGKQKSCRERTSVLNQTCHFHVTSKRSFYHTHTALKMCLPS